MRTHRDHFAKEFHLRQRDRPDGLGHEIRNREQVGELLCGPDPPAADSFPCETFGIEAGRDEPEGTLVPWNPDFQLRARFHLLLYGFGLGADDVHRLIGSLDDMRVHLRQIVQVQPAPLG